MARRFPMIDFDGISVGLYEPDFGALMARRSVLTLVDRFVKAGGTYAKGFVEPPQRGGDRLTRSDCRRASGSTPTASSSPPVPGCPSCFRT